MTLIGIDRYSKITQELADLVSRAEQSVHIPSLYTIPDRSKRKNYLMQALQWYLEDFLEYPFPPDTDTADKILEGWPIAYSLVRPPGHHAERKAYPPRIWS